MHWAHRIKDADALDIVGYCYLFNSLTVRTQLQPTKQGINVDTEKRTLKMKRVVKRICGEHSVTIKTIISTNINKL